MHFKLKKKAKRERTLSKQTKHSQSHSLIGIIVAPFESTEVAQPFQQTHCLDCEHGVLICKLIGKKKKSGTINNSSIAKMYSTCKHTLL